MNDRNRSNPRKQLVEAAAWRAWAKRIAAQQGLAFADNVSDSELRRMVESSIPAAGVDPCEGDTIVWESDGTAGAQDVESWLALRRAPQHRKDG